MNRKRERGRETERYRPPINQARWCVRFVRDAVIKAAAQASRKSCWSGGGGSDDGVVVMVVVVVSMVE